MAGEKIEIVPESRQFLKLEDAQAAYLQQVERNKVLEKKLANRETIYRHSGDPVGCDNADGDATHILGINCGACDRRLLTKYLCKSCAALKANDI